MSEQERLSHPQGGDGAVVQARAEREARLGEWESQLRAGAHPGHDEQLVWHSGQPAPAVQMKTHGQPAPRTPDEGGHDSPSAHIG